MGIPSPYLAWAFPQHGPVADEYLDLVSLSDAEREQWKATPGTLSITAAKRNRRIVLKSPTHTARVKTLLEVFPDARFVHIVRDPLALFPSTMRLWNTLSQVQGLQTVDEGLPWVERQVLDTFTRMYARFEQDRELIPAGHLAELHFEELVADPVGQIECVYDQLGLDDFAAVHPSPTTPPPTAATAPAVTRSRPPPPSACAATGHRTSNATAMRRTTPIPRRHRP